MKIDKKGLTLMELLVAIVLIGLILTFLFQLLSDLKNERENNNFAQNNQVNRIEIMHAIGDDLNKYTLESITDNSSNCNFEINFNYRHANETQTAVLKTYKQNRTTGGLLSETITDYYVSYVAFDGTKHTWKMKGAEIDPFGTFTFYKDNTSNKYYFKLHFFVYNTPEHIRNNKENNNAVDDLEISYVGLKSSLKDIPNSLTTTNIVDKQIGYCTN